MRTRTCAPLLFLAPLALAALPLAPGSAAAAAGAPVSVAASRVPGPGAVIELHRRLFAALDAGDRDAVAGILHPERTLLYLVDAAGHPRTWTARDAALADLPHWLDDGRGGWTTTVVSTEADCPSGELSWAAVVFERRRPLASLSDDAATAFETRRYRGTALVAWVDGALRLFQWHVSPAPVANTGGAR